jgi:hypothetical protein
MELDQNFHSVDTGCYPCDIPYQYIIKQETFAKDYQFILQKHGLWEKLSNSAKQLVTKKSKYLISYIIENRKN